AAALAAVSASISTPVCPFVLTSVTIFKRYPDSVFQLNEISTPDSDNGWHIGMIWCVFFAAMIPAIWATESTSPFLILSSVIALYISSVTSTELDALAILVETSLSETSTILRSEERRVGKEYRLRDSA